MFDSKIHHRRSIRMPGYDYSLPGAYYATICTDGWKCLFGKVVDGEIVLNGLGRIVSDCWFELPNHFNQIQLDEFVMMPNHVHFVLWITEENVGAGFPRPRCENVGAGFPRPRKDGNRQTIQLGGGMPCVQHHETMGGGTPPKRSDDTMGGETPPLRRVQMMGGGIAPIQHNETKGGGTPPLRPTLGQIVAYFKYRTTKGINALRKTPGKKIWQRNYYEHVIRDEEELNRIREYITLNPEQWEFDKYYS